MKFPKCQVAAISHIYVYEWAQASFLRMSQHHISTNRYKILIGWDRPLQYFFGTVWEKAQPGAHDGKILFTTLSLPRGGVDTIAELARLLRPYVELPVHLKAALTEDQVVNCGNEFYEWKLESINTE